MRILIRKASDYKGNEKEIREVTPQDLINLIDEFGSSIIVEKNGTEEHEFTGRVVNGKNELISIGVIDYNVTIYDDYIE